MNCLISSQTLFQHRKRLDLNVVDAVVMLRVFGGIRTVQQIKMYFFNQCAFFTERFSPQNVALPPVWLQDFIHFGRIFVQ